MQGHIDWLSFTRPSEAVCDDHANLYYIARDMLKGISNEHETYLFNGTGFDVGVGRPPYRYALERDDRSVRLFGGGHLANILCECTGRACEGLRGYQSSASFIAPIVDNLTRLDFAVDIRTEIRPSAFANERDVKSFRSVSYISSGTGETVYIGSPKSDRFARVYRYNKPHPRSADLRVEFVFRRGLAKAAGRALLDAGNFEKFSASLGRTWGWTHEIWHTPYKDAEKLKTPMMTRADADTIAWLYKSVRPAIRRVLASGALDLDDFLSELDG